MYTYMTDILLITIYVYNFKEQKMNLRNLIVIMVIVLLASCKKENNKRDVNTYSINESIINMQFKWPQSIKLLQCIKLETNNESLIGCVKKVEIINDKIFVLDSKSKAIIIFDKNGTFINKVNKLGEGPQGYIELRDFMVDSKSKTILVLDYKKIIKYNFEGDYVSSVKLGEINPLQFIATNENDYFLWTGTSNSKDKNCIYYWDGDKYSGLLENSNYIIETQRFTRNYENNFLLVPPIGDFNIYEVSEKKIRTKYTIDFGKLVPSQSDIITEAKIDEMNDKAIFTRITNVQETQKWLYILAKGPYGKYYEILINKITKQKFCGTFNNNTSFQIIYSNQNALYALVEPSYIADAKKESIIFSLKSLHIDTSDNPLLIKFSL